MISIHAPARGATFGAAAPHIIDQFQSTLPRGERLSPFSVWIINVLFQSTLPRGERRNATVYRYFITYDISIHAPARGATCRQTQRRRSSGYFNPRSREGSDRIFRTFSNSFFVFQSTLPRGERHSPFRIFSISLLISIHAPARGATSILSKIHPMFLTISHNASSFSSFPFHSFLPHLLNSSTFCALFQVRISRAFSVYYRFAPKKSTPDLQLYHVLHRYVQL